MLEVLEFKGHAPKWHILVAVLLKSSLSSEREPLTQSITINDFNVRGFEGF